MTSSPIGTIQRTNMEEIKWKRMKMGYRFPADAIVIYDGDPDPRLSRCAVYDGYYILVKDLYALPKEK